MMRNVGIQGVKAPTKTCEDEDCPWHGTISVRGKVLQGKAVSLKVKGLAVIQREYYHYVKKYKRYEKRRSRVHAHIPSCISIKEGEEVVVAECRPISKTVSFIIIGKAGV
ncbi:MAG: 30S ribosomal protein S17 [Conexivisphaerales archaeon]|jgi:small subunit ribosomal protein S17